MPSFASCSKLQLPRLDEHSCAFFELLHRLCPALSLQVTSFYFSVFVLAIRVWLARVFLSLPFFLF